MNNITNVNLIYPGQKLRIIANKSHSINTITNPNLDITYIAKKGDTLWGIAKKFGVTVDYLANKMIFKIVI